MSGKQVQKTIDKIWQATIFRILPVWFKPNYFTFARFVMIPVVIFLLSIKFFGWGLLAFLLAAAFDSLDGSLARIRKQTTSLGIFLDPIADKLLVILTSVFLMYYYPFSELLFAVLLFDFLLIIFGLGALYIYSGQSLPKSNWTGKLKMTFQSTGLLLVFVTLSFSSSTIFYFSALFLFLGVVFGFLSIFSYSLRMSLVE